MRPPSKCQMRVATSSITSWSCVTNRTVPSYRCKAIDRKSTRLNSSHLVISYAVFCLKNKADINTLKTSSPKYWNRLFHNNGDGAFTDVTEKAGLVGTGFDVGVFFGDYDNHGYAPIFPAGVYRN